MDWNESATFNSPTGDSNPWLDDACDTQFTISTLDYQDDTVEFDITYAVQHAHASGNDSINLAFYVVGDTSDDWRFASSDYTTDESKRPKVSLNWRTGEQWLPGEPTNLHPLDGSTIWAENSSRPMGAENTTMNWTSSVTNETRWIMEYSIDPSFTNETFTYQFDFSNNATFNGTWDSSNLNTP